MGAAPQSRTEFPTEASATASKGAGQQRLHPRYQEDQCGDSHRDRERGPLGVGSPNVHGFAGKNGDLLGVHLDTEGGRHLLECDDHPDAEGEALHDGDRNVADELARADVPETDQDDPGEQANDQDAVGSVGRDDRHEDHSHRPGRPTDLDPAAAEDGGNRACHDRGHEPGGGAHARAGSEPERQGEGHQPDHDPCGQVAAGPRVRPVRPSRQQPHHTRQGCASCLRHAWAGDSSASSSPRDARIPDRMFRAAMSRSRTSGTLTE